MTTTRKAVEVIEKARQAHRRPRLSIRAAADLAGTTDAIWRNIVHGRSTPRPEQLLDMAVAVQVGDQVADIIGASESELREAEEAFEQRIHDAAVGDDPKTRRLEQRVAELEAQIAQILEERLRNDTDTTGNRRPAGTDRSQ